MKTQIIKNSLKYFSCYRKKEQKKKTLESNEQTFSTFSFNRVFLLNTLI